MNGMTLEDALKLLAQAEARMEQLVLENEYYKRILAGVKYYGKPVAIPVAESSEDIGTSSPPSKPYVKVVTTTSAAENAYIGEVDFSRYPYLSTKKGKK